MIKRVGAREKRCEGIGRVACLDAYGGWKDDGMHGLGDRVDVRELEYEYVVEKLRIEAYVIARQIHHALIEIQRFGVCA